MSCSFCNSWDHSIRGCQDPMISFLFERLKILYVDIMNQYPNDTETRFKSALNRRFNMRELRAVCATRTGFSSSGTKSQIICKLYQYFSSHIGRQQIQEDESSRRLPTQPDPIPDFARDLEQTPEEEHDITWYIDNTPSPVSVLGFAMIQEPATGATGTTGATPEYVNSDIMRELTGDDQIRMRDFVGVNLMSHFDAVSGNIPFTPQVKKYNITPVLEVEDGGEESEEVKEEGKEVEVEEDCAICYESVKCMDLVLLNCMHKFCGSCIQQTLKSHNKLCGPSCALCRKQMVSFTVKNQEIYNLVSEHCNL